MSDLPIIDLTIPGNLFPMNPHGIYLTEVGISYWVNGKLHRLDGPAIETYNQYKEWYVNGKRHRLDGPALESIHGQEIFYINDIRYFEKDYWNKVKDIYISENGLEDYE